MYANRKKPKGQSPNSRRILLPIKSVMHLLRHLQPQIHSLLRLPLHLLSQPRSVFFVLSSISSSWRLPIPGPAAPRRRRRLVLAALEAGVDGRGGLVGALLAGLGGGGAVDKVSCAAAAASAYGGWSGVGGGRRRGDGGCGSSVEFLFLDILQNHHARRSRTRDQPTSNFSHEGGSVL